MKSYFTICQNYIKADPIIKRIFLKRLLNKVKLNKFSLLSDKKYYYKNQKQVIPEILINIEDLSIENCNIKVFDFLSDMYMSHRFNVLGSGWVSADYCSRPLGIEGIVYEADSKRPFAERVKKRVDKDYLPIDWHRDLKSGFLFNAEKPSMDIFSNIPRGVDIKMPWEIARMYHLPQMSLASLLIDNKKELMIREFKNQFIDFCESNPIGYGVNWSCAMEVAIRAVNLLVAYDIFVQQDTFNIIDEDFKKYFSEKLIEHGRFIIKNLEINFVTGKSSNHYLSDLCGLLFIGTYIKNHETKKWVDFSTKEFLKEFDNQFLDDGGNYEGSTAYHRLSAEISAYCFALIIRNGVIIEKRILKKLNSVANFAILTIKPNEDIIQIGDNDSGRLLKLNLYGKFMTTKEYEENYYNAVGYSCLYKDEEVFVENDLCIYPIVAIIFAITKYNHLEAIVNKSPLEHSVIKSLLNERTALSDEAYNYSELKKLKYEYDLKMPDLIYKKVTSILLPTEGLDFSKIKLEYAPYFGLAAFTLDNLKIFVRSVTNLNMMSNSHIHNDFLHFEISIDEKNYFSDQGSYIYTPLLDRRDEFRSVKAHNVPYYGIETNIFKDCFFSYLKIKGFVDEITNNSIGMVIFFEDIVHYRKIEIMNNEIIVTDNSNKPFVYECKEFEFASCGYGKLIKKKGECCTLIIK